jgi:acyl-CoA synthetase (AMP-forming)/AMP-acid ligase II
VTYCLRELAYYKAPGWVLFRQELPTTPTNKIQKNLIFKPIKILWMGRGIAAG